MRRAVLFLALLLVIAAVTPPALAEDERRSGYFTLVDIDTGRALCRTGHVVRAGDQYMTDGNLLYSVVRVRGDSAYARFVRRINLDRALANARQGWLAGIWRAAVSFLAGGRPTGPVAIYHTHGDESYVPTDGTASRKGEGGIYQVGRSLAARLRRRGLPVEHSYASHEPHDGMAYERSRRTAASLLRKNPAALFDIHRDAGPRSEYASVVDNQGVTKVQIVLGRSNPNLKANESFAWRLKSVVDKKYPGLIKGIFYGSGKYNQDLSPRALLLELGTEANSKQAAERGASIFGEAAVSVIEAGTRGGVAGRFGGNSGAWRAILYVLGGVLVVAVFFLLLNAGSFRGAASNLGGFFRREFASAMGDRKRSNRRKEDKGGRHRNRR
ncbi:MAG: stage II sporulation protein P [Patescibacteria group bacterium]